MSRLVQLLLIGSALFMAACSTPPERYVVWAPDGNRAFVQSVGGADGTRIAQMVIDGSGAVIGPHVVRNEILLAWMPDSRALITSSWKPASDWPEYASVIGYARATQVVRAAKQLARIIERYHGDWSKFGVSGKSKAAVDKWIAHSIVGPWTDITPELFYLEQKRPSLVAPLVRQARILSHAMARSKSKRPQYLVDESELVPDIYTLAMRNDVMVPRLDAVISQSTAQYGWAQPSRSGKFIAFVRDDSTSRSGGSLYVVANQPRSHAVHIADGVDSAAWSPDGQELAFIRPIDPDAALHGYSNLGALQLGTLEVSHVLSSQSEVVTRPVGSEVIAVLNISQDQEVAWLPDGRIIFASMPLPASTQSDTRATLFAVRFVHGVGTSSYVMSMPKAGQIKFGMTATLPDPSKRALNPQDSLPPGVDRVVAGAAQERIPDPIEAFVVSPDGAKIAMLGKHGEVAVLFLDSGNVQVLQPSISLDAYDNDSISIPSWRGTDELSYVVSAGQQTGTNRQELVLDSLNGSRHLISTAWPDISFLPSLKHDAQSRGETATTDTLQP